MAQKIDPSETGDNQGLHAGKCNSNRAITQLLIDKGIITHEEFVTKLKQVQSDYMSRKRQ